ncbi:MAG: acyl-CoA dehydrogenase family protein [Deltaproteobacteria bacterium]|nr:acyl-CoA dehydrogenase family protein [Deltaproteobacteria bacterium]
MAHPELTEENRLFRDAIREFARKEVAPLVAEAEETNTPTEGTSEIQRLVIAREEGY